MHKISDIIINTHNQLSKVVADQGAIEKIKNILYTLEIFKQNPTHYRVSKFSQGILYLSVSSAAFATQIRHHSLAILQTLQKNLVNIQFNAIQCKVSTLTQSKQPSNVYQKSKAKNISEKTRTGLLKLSEKTSSGELREALRKLSMY